MTIEPYVQFQQLLAAFSCGLLLGVLADVCQQLFVLLGVCSPQASLAALYARPLPLIGRSARRLGGDACSAVPNASCGVATTTRARRIARATRLVACRVARALLVGAAELLFPILAALSLLLVSFRYDRGSFRLAVAVLLLVGLFLWRGMLSRRLTFPLSLVVFLLVAVGVYLRTLLALPFRLAFRLFLHHCWMPLRRALGKIHLFYQKKRSAVLCTRQLKAAQNGLRAPSGRSKVKEKRRKYVEKKQKRARQRLDSHDRDPRADRFDLRGGADHSL